MPDRVADDGVHAASTRNVPGPVEVLHRLERELAGCCGLLDGGIGQSTSCPQREDTPGKANLVHGDGHSISAGAGNASDLYAIADGIAHRRDFDSVAPGPLQPPNDFGKARRCAAEIMVGDQKARGVQGAPEIGRSNVGCRLNLDVAPIAACADRLRKYFELRFAVSPKQTTSLACAAGCDDGSLESLMAQPTQEGFSFPDIAEVVEAHLKGSRGFEAPEEVRTHLVRCGSSNNRADALFTKRPSQARLPVETLNSRLVPCG